MEKKPQQPTPFEMREWWYANNPRKGLQANVGMDCKWVKKAFVELKVTEEEFQKLAVFGWGNEDQRVKDYSRLGIATFVKEIPHLRELFTPGKAWAPPEEERDMRYAQGTQVMQDLKNIAASLVQKPKPRYVEDQDARRKFYGAKP